MKTIYAQSPATPERARTRLYAVADTAWRMIFMALYTVLGWHERVKQRHHLGRLDEHRLKDLGLSRADVERETGKPFWKS